MKNRENKMENSSTAQKENETPNKDMTVLDVVGRWPAAQDVFREYDAEAGECIMCQALFDTLSDVALRYGLDLAAMLDKLARAAERGADDPAGPSAAPG